MGHLNRLQGRLLPYPYTRTVHYGVPVHLSSVWPSHGPTGLYNDSRGSEADGPDKGASPIPGRLAHQGPVSERSTSEH